MYWTGIAPILLAVAGYVMWRAFRKGGWCRVGQTVFVVAGSLLILVGVWYVLGMQVLTGAILLLSAVALMLAAAILPRIVQGTLSGGCPGGDD